MQIIFHMLPKSSVINFSPLSSVISCVCFYKQIINKQPLHYVHRIGKLYLIWKLRE